MCEQHSTGGGWVVHEVGAVRLVQGVSIRCSPVQCSVCVCVSSHRITSHHMNHTRGVPVRVGGWPSEPQPQPSSSPTTAALSGVGQSGAGDVEGGRADSQRAGWLATFLRRQLSKPARQWWQPQLAVAAEEPLAADGPAGAGGLQLPLCWLAAASLGYRQSRLPPRWSIQSAPPQCCLPGSG